jgi:hypothetical protein
MFDIFLKPNNDKTISEKGLDNVITYTNKASRDIAHLADHNRVASNNFITFGSNLGEDLSVSLSLLFPNSISHLNIGCHE